jgi:predicted amidohydrolase YtcJ
VSTTDHHKLCTTMGGNRTMPLSDWIRSSPSLAAPLVSFAALALAQVACAGRQNATPADLILLNGRVVTLDPEHPEAEALAVREGRITAIGGNEAILPLAGPGTRRIDLAGKMVLPGLVDAHGHVRSLGERLDTLDLKGAASVEEVARRVAARITALGPGEWVTGGGWDQNLWPGKAFPDHRPITAAAPDRAVWLKRVDGHAGWANLEAMRAAGVTRDTPDPEGGVIERGALGEPTGVFIDNAMDLIDAVRPPAGHARVKSWIRLGLERCAEVGLTEVHDAGVTEMEVAAYRELADAGELPVRVYLMWSGMPDGSAHALEDAERRLAGYLEQPPLINYADRLTLRSVKLMIDGAMGSRGAVFFEDYADDPGNRGLLVMTPEAIERSTVLALRRGYQVCTHAIGDRGIHLVLEAYEKALAAVPTEDPRLRIEHLQCVRRADIERLSRLNIIASMQPSHATSDMGWADDRVGPQRGQGLYSWRWVLDAGVALAAGSDFPVDPERPLVGIHAAVTRQDRKGRPEGGWHPGQRMSLDEALRAYTTGAAYAAFEENDKGRLAPGFRADLTVLSDDLRAIPAEAIPLTRVNFTIVGGTIVYEAD